MDKNTDQGLDLLKLTFIINQPENPLPLGDGFSGTAIIICDDLDAIRLQLLSFGVFIPFGM